MDIKSAIFMERFLAVPEKNGHVILCPQAAVNGLLVFTEKMLPNYNFMLVSTPANFFSEMHEDDLRELYEHFVDDQSESHSEIVKQMNKVCVTVELVPKRIPRSNSPLSWPKEGSNSEKIWNICKSMKESDKNEIIKACINAGMNSSTASMQITRYFNWVNKQD